MPVGQLISTSPVLERERLAFWVEAVAETLLELKVDSRAGPDFRGEIESFQVGPLGVNFLCYDDEHITRTLQAISRSKRDYCYLLQARNNPRRFKQLNREIEVEPGSCTLVDSRYPFELEHEKDRDALTIAIPTDWLLTWLPAPEEVVLQEWQPGQGWGGVLATALATLTPASIANLPVLPSIFCDQLGALIAMATAGEGNPPVRARSTLLDRIRDTLRGRIPRPGACAS